MRPSFKIIFFAPAFVLAAACSADSQTSGGMASSASSWASSSVDIRASIDAGLAKGAANPWSADIISARTEALANLAEEALGLSNRRRAR